MIWFSPRGDILISLFCRNTSFTCGLCAFLDYWSTLNSLSTLENSPEPPPNPAKSLLRSQTTSINISRSLRKQMLMDRARLWIKRTYWFLCINLEQFAVLSRWFTILVKLSLRFLFVDTTTCTLMVIVYVPVDVVFRTRQCIWFLCHLYIINVVLRISEFYVIIKQYSFRNRNTSLQV